MCAIAYLDHAITPRPITDEEISIVVQGPILYESAYGITTETTRMICARIRALFPKSELILSTWSGQETTGIDYDRVIYSTDPGGHPFCYGDNKLLNNNNRLIVSTFAGVAAATRRYVLKIRSDLFMVNKDFLNYFYQFPCFDSQYRFVKNRIIAFSLYSVKAHKTCLFTVAKPFHISDWAYFGYREDIYNLYDIPLADEPGFSQWFMTHCRYFDDIHPDRLWKMPPEQYITVNFLKKYIDFNFEHRADTANNNVLLSEKLLTNNFLVLDQTQFALISLKYVCFQLLFDWTMTNTAIFYHTWLTDYLEHSKVTARRERWYYKMQIIRRRISYRITNFILRCFSSLIPKIASFLLKKWYNR